MLDILDPNSLITMAILFLTSIPIHEWAHAWTAYRLGDDTAARRGRLTLNPLAHLDPVGVITLVLFGYGWGKPVPVSPYRLRGNWRTSWALVSAAGPFSNFVLALLAAIPLRLGLVSSYSSAKISLPGILMSFILINLSLMLFNLIPVPPLDGSRILGRFMPERWADAMDRLERYGGIALMFLLYLLSRLGVFRLIISPAMRFLLRALL